MNELTIYIAMTLFAALLSGFLSIYATLRLKEAPGARYFILTTAACSLFTLAYAFELKSTNLEQVKFWLRIEYIGLPFIPAFILFMCLEYVGQKVKPYLFYLTFTIPFLTIFMHFTNDFHHLYYSSVELQQNSSYVLAKLTGGPFFYFHSFYLYVCVLFGLILLLKELKKPRFRFRMQIAMMICGLLIPVAGSIFYLTGLSPNGIDLGPVSMSISFLFHAAALLSFQMFNVAPIARDKVFENMREGVIVLNRKNIVIDYNKAVLDIIPSFSPQAVGKAIDQVLPYTEKLAGLIADGEDGDYETGNYSHYHIRFSIITNKNGQYLGRIITFSDVTERVVLQRQLTQLATVDGLTQVLNKTAFMKEAVNKISEEPQTAVVMFDIDRFKYVNDTYGHEAGDKILAEIAWIVKEGLRKNDIFGRYGGEEFVICLFASAEETKHLMEKIRLKIAGHSFAILDRNISITSSFGIASSVPRQDNAEQALVRLMREADVALYASKKNGRNQVQLYEPEMLSAGYAVEANKK